jgi:DNA-binding PadR family transcriptional regulator
MPFNAFQSKYAAMRAKRTGSREPVTANRNAHTALKAVLNTPLAQVAKRTGVERGLLGWSVKRVFGRSYLELQREARLAFIEQHQGMADADLASALKMNKDSVSKYVAFLKKEGRIADTHRQTGKSYLKQDALPFQRQPLAHEIISTLAWIKNGASFNTQELVLATGKHKEALLRTLKGLREGGLVATTKQGNALLFRITPEGHQWLRKMAQLTAVRERRALRGEKDLSRMIRKKRADKERLVNLQIFLARQGEAAKAEEIRAIIARLTREEAAYRRELSLMQQRKAQ